MLARKNYLPGSYKFSMDQEITRPDLFKTLTPSQYEAVCSEGRPLMVVAGPGSGKTLTLISRILYLLTEKSIPPENILAVTFTNKAAHEIYERLQTKVTVQASTSLNIGTFHKICLALLMKELRPGQSVLIDENDCILIIKEILEKFDSKEKAENFYDRIKFCKNRLVIPQEEFLLKVYQEYEKILNLMGLLDLDGILIKTLNILKSGPDTLIRYQQQYKYILVDEFQDINLPQFQIIQLLANGGKRLFVIGDADQSIYAFRGADQSFLLDLPKYFPAMQTIHLDKTFRCVSTIMDSAQNLIRYNKQRLDYRMSAENDSRGEIFYVNRQSERIMGIHMANEITRLVGGIDMLESHGIGIDHVDDHNYSFTDIAILVRSYFQVDDICYCLKTKGIPYKLYGSQNFYASQYLKQVIILLKFLAYPHSLFHFKQMLTLSFFQFNSDLINKLLDKFALVTGNHKESGAETSNGDDHITRKSAIIQSQLQVIINDLLKFIVNVLNSDKGSMKNRAGLNRMKNLFEILVSAEDSAKTAAVLTEIETWEKTDEICFLKNLVRDSMNIKDLIRLIVLKQDADYERYNIKQAANDYVHIMSLHASKGLEFPVVFVSGLEQGLIPFDRNVFIRENATINISPDQLEEERRLFYVGITRAKQFLYLYNIEKRLVYGKKLVLPVSQYINELGKNNLTELKDSFKVKQKKKNIQLDFGF